jgi:hypothetical protein
MAGPIWAAKALPQKVIMHASLAICAAVAG